MKKFYTILAAAAMMASSASAQSLYFKGSGEGLSWDVANDLEVTLQDGKYTVTINNLTSFKVSAVSSAATVTTEDGNTLEGWDAFNSKALYAPGCGSTANLGTPLATEFNSGPNNNVPFIGDYTIVVSEDLSTMTLTTTTPIPTDFTKVYLRGDMNNWLNDASEETLAMWQMTTDDGVKYWFECTDETMIPAGTGFKIADINWATINYGLGDEVFAFEDPFLWIYNSDNSIMAEDYTGTILLNLIGGVGEPAEVTVFPGTNPDGPFSSIEDITVDANAPVEYFNIHGVRVANPENGIYIVRQGAKVSKIVK